MARITRRRFVGLLGLVAGTAVVAMQLGDRLTKTDSNVLDQLGLDSSTASDDLLDLGRAVIAVSPESVDRLGETIAKNPNATISDTLTAAARSHPGMAPVRVDGWLLADSIAGVAGAYARAADNA